MSSGSLAGRLLLASTTLQDPNFLRTVVLIGMHSDQGTLGLVLNRPSAITVADAVPALEQMMDEDEPVYVGGPVQPGAIVMLAEFLDPDAAGILVLGRIGLPAPDAPLETLADVTERRQEEEALQLLSLPRVVGVDTDGEEITAQNGRYGPYIKKGTDSRSLGAEEQLFSVTLPEAQAIFAQPKQRRGRVAKPPLADLGPHPESGAPVRVLDGRFGPYITDGTTNATVPRGIQPEAVTMAEAVELLAERAAALSEPYARYLGDGIRELRPTLD